jgi:molecular chaperone DnaJ
MSAVDFHQILGVAPDASAAEIKRAYKRLAMRWHPDRNADPQAHVQFRLVREAFEHLSRP